MNNDTPESLGFDKPTEPKRTEKLTLEERQARMLSAISRGMQQDESIGEAIYRLWRITPNLRRKDWKELILFLKEAGEPVDKLEAFARWWREEDWRGKKGQPPTADNIRTYLALALEKCGSAEDDRKRYNKWME